MNTAYSAVTALHHVSVREAWICTCCAAGKQAH